MSYELGGDDPVWKALRLVCAAQLQSLAADVSPEEFWHISALFGFNRPPPAGMNLLTHFGRQFDSIVARVRAEKAKAAATGHKLALEDMWRLPPKVPPAL